MFLPQLTIVKLLYFIWFGATSCLLPFLTLHMRSVGIPLWEASIISAIVPLLQLLPFSMTSCIPKSGSTYKKATLWSILFTAIATLLLVYTPLVPQATRQQVSMNFQCGPKKEPSIVLDKCNYECENDTSLLKNIEMFFMECYVKCSDKLDRFKNTADFCFNDRHGRLCHVMEINNTLSDNFTFGAYLGQSLDTGENTCSYPLEGVMWHQRFFHQVSCPIILNEFNSNCVLRCDMKEGTKPRISGSQLCLNVAPNLVDIAKVIYFCLRALFHICFGISSMFIERALLHVLEKERQTSKKYRFLSLVASGIATPLGGLILDHFPTDHLEKYKFLIMLFFVLVMISSVIISTLNIEGADLQFTQVKFSAIIQLLSSFRIGFLFFSVFLSGAVSGFLDAFLFWNLEDKSCPYYVMGLTVTVGLVSGLPFTTKKMQSFFLETSAGYLVSLSVLLQSMRGLGYFLNIEYWWCFLFEFLGFISTNFLWTAMSPHGKSFNPPEQSVPFRSCMGVMHYCLGKSFGGFIGGIWLMESDFKRTCAYLSSFSATIGVIYFVLYHFLLKKFDFKPSDQPKRDATGNEGVPSAIPLLVFDEQGDENEMADEETNLNAT